MDKKLVLIFILTAFDPFLPSFANQQCVSSGVSSADDLVITNGKRRVRGSSVDNIQQVQIRWEPNIEQNKATFDEYDLTKLKLYILKQDGEWEEYVPKKQVKYHGHYKWAVPRIPCLKYDYKILVPSKNKANTFLCTAPKSKLPETKDTIRSAKFKPEPPTDIVMSIESNQASFRWNKSQCAEEYELYVTDSDQGESRNGVAKQLDDVNGANAEFDNLKSCTSYEVEVYAKVEGGEDGEEFLKESFETKPDIDSASHLDLTDTSTTASDATLRFFTYMDKVNCLKKFTVETCKDSFCFQLKNMVIDQNHEELKYSSNGLEHCTNYFLKVQPSYLGVNIKPNEVKITTKLDETKVNFSPAFVPQENEVKITLKNTDCLDTFTINYRIKSDEEEGSGDGGWKEVSSKRENGIIGFTNLQPNSTYQVNMTASKPQSLGQIPIFKMKEFKTLLTHNYAIETTTKSNKAILTSNIPELEKRSTESDLNRNPRNLPAENSVSLPMVFQGIISVTLLVSLHAIIF